jgi:hypothetical protein
VWHKKQRVPLYGSGAGERNNGHGATERSSVIMTDSSAYHLQTGNCAIPVGAPYESVVGSAETLNDYGTHLMMEMVATSESVSYNLAHKNIKY